MKVWATGSGPKLTANHTYFGLSARNPDFIVYEQQRHRPACVCAQSDQRKRFRSLQSMISKLTSKNVNVLPSLCS